jgi:hypothetical protein
MATNQVASAEQSVKMALQAQTAGGQTAQQVFPLI